MSGSEKEAVLNVFAALVRPLMRAAFEYGITASEIAGVIRRVYIQSLEARLSELTNQIAKVTSPELQQLDAKPALRCVGCGRELTGVLGGSFHACIQSDTLSLNECHPTVRSVRDVVGRIG